MKYFLNKKTTVQVYELNGSWDAKTFDANYEFNPERYMLIKSPEQHIELYFGVINNWLTVDDNSYGFAEYETGLHILVNYLDIDAFIVQ
ncbi:hypothetical protein UFOVP755_37 [uncultured Caudovirales phage]|uniref:Uncharacterized protein n=1 Tax=uncultured Caudovirales phage TaxID=2100421 RepID=A0A6J7X5Z5_9CAUD|nr:hypothetical protein UFOVP755_37 [uncultured Caudovirales phage]